MPGNILKYKYIWLHTFQAGLCIVLISGNALAQVENCVGDHTQGQPVSCEYDETSVRDINLDIRTSTIETTGDDNSGIEAKHEGNADIRTNVENTDIATQGIRSLGIINLHQGDGNIRIDFMQGAIETNFDGTGLRHEASHGILGWHEGIGKVDLVITDATIETRGEQARGIYGGVGNYFVLEDPDQQAIALGRVFSRDITITAKNVNIKTSSRGAHGIAAWHKTSHDSSHGDISISVQGGRITTTGSNAEGISAYHQSTGTISIILSRGTVIETEGFGIVANGQKSSPGGGEGRNSKIRIYGNGVVIDIKGTRVNGRGVFGWNRNRHGGIEIEFRDSTISTTELLTYGILAYQSEDSTGNILINLRNTAIETKSTDNYQGRGSLTHGVYALNNDSIEGDITVSVEGGSVKTHGSSSHGINAVHQKTGDIAINAASNHDIITLGEGSHGIYARHFGTDEDRVISILTGNIEARGEGAAGVRIGGLNRAGMAQQTASIDDTGYRRNSIMVNGNIIADTGVFLAGGGRVFLESTGTIDARSRIAILASGDNPGPTGPKLLVELTLDDRDMVEVIGDGWIINDGGETTILVNGVLLHDGATGVVPGAFAPYGAYDWQIKPDGLMITDRSSDTWTFSPRREGLVTDRDFSADDFVRVRAPRSAIYETLPAALASLDRHAACGERGSPADQTSDYPYWWGQIAESKGQYRRSGATYDLDYDFERRELAVGRSARLAEDVDGCLAFRKVAGTIDVSSSMWGGVESRPRVLAPPLLSPGRSITVFTAGSRHPRPFTNSISPPAAWEVWPRMSRAWC